MAILLNLVKNSLYIDLNISSLNWCSLLYCNWSIPLGIAYILALRDRRLYVFLYCEQFSETRTG